MNKKLAFTIAEALMSMLILSIFIGLSMRVFTKKHTKPVYNPSHGYYICYRGVKNDATYNTVYKKVGPSDPVDLGINGKCDFTPVKTASFYVIYTVGGGGGGAGGKGGSPGEFQTLFVTNIADSLQITPGKGGTAGNDGQPTYIRNNEPGATDEEKTISEVAGGLKGGASSVKQAYIRSCNVVPLATLLDPIANPDGKKYLDNNHDDKATCQVTSTSLKAKLCPHSNKDIRQEDEIKEFYKDYATNAASAASNWKNKNYDFYYTYGEDCITQLKGGANYRKYCVDHKNGDQLYYYNPTHGNWYLAGLNDDGSAKCLTETLDYSDIKIDEDTDSFTIIRSKEDPWTHQITGKFKYFIDLKYDLSNANNTAYYMASGFGKYIESSSLRDGSVDSVLFLKGVRNLTAATTDKQFDPSAGDGGANGRSGIGGAVLIAW